ncbi:F-box protein cpr1 [Thalictrum thalictroides]|uniref:F-box protein cpr1 n=1 Tax=Thalictrum thalictroides TaxID=46969 RepID=A0A7J6W5N7_THATH|nr:F-box protein cpr1 [Thalictrum thalictroides]
MSEEISINMATPQEEEAKRKRETTLKSIWNDIRKRGKTLSFVFSNDITREILSRVPVEDLLRFKVIYCEILSSSSLTLSRAVKIDHPFKSAGIHVYGSCNGIFLIRFFHQFHRIGLWNPSTREYKDLPQNFPKYPKHPPPFFEVVFWLGYDASRDDYKVIRYPYYHKYSISWAIMSDVYVYSLRTNSCKKIQDVPYYIFGSVYPNLSCDDGIMLNSALHWLGRHFLDSESGFSLIIVSFDLASDEFKNLQVPDVVLDTKLKRLGVFEECLSIYHVNKDNCIDVFMMKEYGMKESWTKKFSITDQPIQCMRIFKPMCVTKDGKLLVLWNHKDLALYDPKHGGRRCSNLIHGIPRNVLEHCGTCIYVNSLVSLGANTYM